MKTSTTAQGVRNSVVIGAIRLILTISLIFQAVISLVQVLLGHTIGGLMYYVGERTIAVGSPNIALGTFMGTIVLRAYGTFSHPNTLAGYAVIGLLIILLNDTKISKLKRVYFPLFLTSLIIFLSQSRSAAIALFGIIIPFYLIKNLRHRLLYFVLSLFVVVYVLTSGIISRSDLSYSERLNLQRVSSEVISKYPIFGTGAQASISTYPGIISNFRLLQPDHNSFTLFLSWFGICSVIALLSRIQILSNFKQLIRTLKPLFPLLPLLLLDHYLLTSIQGQFIFILYLVIAVNYHHAQKNI